MGPPTVVKSEVLADRSASLADAVVASQIPADRSGFSPRRSEQSASKLGWRHRTNFDTLVSDMVKADMAAVLAERERRNRHA